MIKIKAYKNALILNGHANFSAYGTDIVCAGVSAIVIGALNWFDQTTTKIQIKDGNCFISVLETDLKQQTYIEQIRIQLLAMVANYGSYLDLETINEFYRKEH